MPNSITEAYQTINPHRLGESRVLLLCDHASNRVPVPHAEFIDDVSALDSHIGIDIGAANVTRAMADMLDSPAVLAGYSRLYIDLNRHPNDFTAMRSISDGVVIRGNMHLNQDEKQKRIASLFDPYHTLIDTWREAYPTNELAIIFVHSFTPIYKTHIRPWQIGILSDADKRLSRSFLSCWENQHADLTIGDNQPYSGEKTYSYSIRRHAESQGNLYIGLEIRQDLIDSPDKARHWAGLISNNLMLALKNH